MSLYLRIEALRFEAPKPLQSTKRSWRLLEQKAQEMQEISLTAPMNSSKKRDTM
jgi:hypothetical protein